MLVLVLSAAIVLRERSSISVGLMAVAMTGIWFTGSRAGKLYGLVGLRHTNRRLFTVAVQPFRIWPGEVETQFGCIGQSVPVREVVENPAAVRLNVGESVGDAFRRRNAFAKCGPRR